MRFGACHWPAFLDTTTLLLTHPSGDGGGGGVNSGDGAGHGRVDIEEQEEDSKKRANILAGNPIEENRSKLMAPFDN